MKTIFIDQVEHSVLPTVCLRSSVIQNSLDNFLLTVGLETFNFVSDYNSPDN